MHDRVTESLADIAGGDAAVLIPVATAVGIVVAAGTLVWDPLARGRPLTDALALVRGLSPERRARWSAAALVTPPALVVWALGCAHGARAVLGRVAPAAAGVEVAAFALAGVVFVASAVVAALEPTAPA